MKKTEIYFHLKYVTESFIVGKRINDSVIKDYFLKFSLDEIKSIGLELKSQLNEINKIPFKLLYNIMKDVWIAKSESSKANLHVSQNSINNIISQKGKKEERSINQSQFLHVSQNSINNIISQKGKKEERSINQSQFLHVSQNNSVFDEILHVSQNSSSDISLNHYNIISQKEKKEERSINQSQFLFNTNLELKVTGWDIDTIAEKLLNHSDRQYIQIHSVINTIKYPNERTKNKMIVLMRILTSMYNSVYEQFEDEAEDKNKSIREINYIEIPATIFKLIDKNDHKWIKDYLSMYGIEAKDHSYWSGMDRNKKKFNDKIKACSIKYYFNPSVFTKLEFVKTNKDLLSMINRIELRRTVSKLEQMKTPHERLQTIGLTWIVDYLPSMETVLKSIPNADNDTVKPELDKYAKILEYGSSLPKMGVWHRVYNSICNIPKYIRKLMDIVEVDAKAMQINLLLYMAYNDGYISEASYNMYSGDVYTKLCPEIDRNLVKKEITEIYLSNTISAMEKTEIYKVIQEKLPQLNEYARKLKGGSFDKSYTNLSRRLTQMESSIMFEAMSNLNTMGIDCYCLFDAMLCTKENAKIVKDEIDKVFNKYEINTFSEIKN